jgi:hypothetical protein
MRTRIFLVLISCIALQACSSKIAVMTLEQTIENAAEAAKKGSGGASKKLQIEVVVTNGYEVGSTVPIMVVPIKLGASSAVTTKLKMDVDLDAYVSRKAVTGKNSVFILDTATGVLE